MANQMALLTTPTFGFQSSFCKSTSGRQWNSEVIGRMLELNGDSDKDMNVPEEYSQGLNIVGRYLSGCGGAKGGQRARVY